MKRTNIVEQLSGSGRMRELQMAARLSSWIIPLSNMVFRKKHSAVAAFFNLQVSDLEVNAMDFISVNAGRVVLSSAAFSTRCRLA